MMLVYGGLISVLLEIITNDFLAFFFSFYVFLCAESPLLVTVIFICVNKHLFCAIISDIYLIVTQLSALFPRFKCANKSNDSM